MAIFINDTGAQVLSVESFLYTHLAFTHMVNKPLSVESKALCWA